MAAVNKIVTMKDVFVVADNILSPLGNTTAENFVQLKRNISGVKLHSNANLSKIPFYAALFDHNEWSMKDDNNKFTKFEQLLVASIGNALQDCSVDTQSKDTLLIISSTKGNIGLLETEVKSAALKERIALHTSAKLIAGYFHFINKPIVVSNACISGLLGILTGMRMIRSGQYINVVVAGADVVSKFILSGFQSFQATSHQQCKPFDKDRDGINLGEGAATIVLSSEAMHAGGIKVVGGGTSNDANHISGPSRTGEELYGVIKKTLTEANLAPSDIDFISAHGTATIYNDEMEAKAISLAGMLLVPVNSMKGYFGHTLGAAGLIESVVTVQSMRENIVLPTIGFEHHGVSEPINVCSNLQVVDMNNCLKTASGFGGCNGTVLFSKTSAK
jgi:3-oxoacyl-[acyl-carrier-protein] synthase I